MFSEMVGFGEICEKITPIQVVSLLNNMFGAFDKLTESHTKVYKVRL